MGGVVIWSLEIVRRFNLTGLISTGKPLARASSRHAYRTGQAQPYRGASAPIMSLTALAMLNAASKLNALMATNAPTPLPGAKAA